MTRSKRGKGKAPQSAATRPSTSTTPQPRAITLLCWVLNGSTDPFPVDIEDNYLVGHLKCAIVAKKPKAFAYVDPDELRLWKVSGFPPLSLIQGSQLPEGIHRDHKEPQERGH